MYSEYIFLIYFNKYSVFQKQYKSIIYKTLIILNEQLTIHTYTVIPKWLSTYNEIYFEFKT